MATYIGFGNTPGITAQNKPVPTSAARSMHSQPAYPVRQFDIAPCSLDIAITAFQRVANVRVMVTLPDGTLAGFRTAGVSGTYSADEALALLLNGTGLQVKPLDTHTLQIRVRPAEESVDVTASTQELTLAKMTEPVRNIPQSITVVPQAILQDQGVTTLRDTLRNVAGISLAAGEGGAQGDNLTLRGFMARNDIFLDGMRDFGSYYRDPFDLEQVAVLEGPSSVTFGRGSTGGVVNQVSKTPQATKLVAGSLDFASDSSARGTLDIDRKLPSLGEGAAFRLNLMANSSGYAGRDEARYRRAGVAPSLALGLGTPTRLVFSYFHSSEDDTPDYGIPWLFNGPAPVDRSNYYGFKNSDFLRTSADVGTIKVEHDLSNGMTLRNQLRYARYGRDVKITEARLANAAQLTPDTPLSDITVNRGQIAVESAETFLDDQLDLMASFRTGSVRHELVFGLEAARETSDPTRPTFTGVPGTSLLDPDVNQPFAGTSTITSRVDTTAITTGAYAIDTVKLGPHWQVVGGIRWDRFDADYKQLAAPTSAFSRVDNMASWRAALVYKPIDAGSIYFDYGTSFNPSAESLSLSASTQDTAPEKNRTYEVGTKWDLQRGRTSVRASVFRTDKTNAREPDIDNPLINVLSGSQRVDGLEAEISGRITQRWRVLSGYARLNSKVVSSKAYPGSVGYPLANVPKNTFNVWNTFDLPWHFGSGFGAQYVGSRTASSTAPIDPVTKLLKSVPGYWAFNAMLKYQVTERVEVQLNVYNLTDEYYYDEIHPGHIVPGPARAASVSTNFRF